MKRKSVGRLQFPKCAQHLCRHKQNAVREITSGFYGSRVFGGSPPEHLFDHSDSLGGKKCLNVEYLTVFWDDISAIG